MLPSFTVLLVPPESVRVGLGYDPVALTCHVQADNLYWLLNEDFLTQSVVRYRGMGITAAYDFDGDFIQSNLTVTVSEANNNTMVVCEASTNNIPIVASDIATVFIAGIDIM